MSERSLLLMVSAVGLAWWVALRDADRWDAFVYPDRGNLQAHVAAGRFDSLEACRDAASAMLERLQVRTGGDYECGLNCKSQGAGPAICESTER